jgi:hypothetical protein
MGPLPLLHLSYQLRQLDLSVLWHRLFQQVLLLPLLQQHQRYQKVLLGLLLLQGQWHL